MEKTRQGEMVEVGGKEVEIEGLITLIRRISSTEKV